jgi:eukaryotic-like serine/threonine-protein kinase
VNPDTRLVADRYRLDQRIGTGAMGVVWQAHDERLDRTVAIKELLMQPGLSEADAQIARERAMREGRIAARLKHPHAIHVYDVALDNATGVNGASGQVVPWLVMEYLPARSLAAVLTEQGTLSPQEAARIGQQVAAALTAAHEAGIVHRDVKPGNVLLTQDGLVKITDFGISRASWDATVTRTGVLAGTPAYFAPEVARGEPPGPASDVFSLGSTLYAAVEGEPPFGLEDNTLALLRTVAEGRVRAPQRAGPLSAVLMQLLADDPAARPSMPEAARALGAVAASGRSLRRHTTMPGAVTSTVTSTGATQTAMEPLTVDLPAGAPPAVTACLSRPEHPDRPKRRIRWRPGLAVLFGAASCLVALAVVVAVASHVIVPTAGRGHLALAPSAPPPAPRAPVVAHPPAQASSPQPAQPKPGQLEQTVRSYYGLLPDDTTVAWQYLGAAERAQGFQRYHDFWSGISRISIRGPIAVQGSTVLVNLVFEPTNRARTLERYRLTLGNAPNGRVLIESAARVGGSVLAHS